MRISLLDSELANSANAIISTLAKGCAQEQGMGSFSPAIYDTAWVAMLQKPIDGRKRWLFPECLEFLINAQSLDGGWNASISEIDGILNALAALLALEKHRKLALEENSVGLQDFEPCIARARSFLTIQLQNWNVEGSVHVGFEILVPTLLELLKKEGIVFEFPGDRVLSALNKKKLAKFCPDYLYGTMKTTMIHSLEAFIDKIDFDRISQHKVNSSMMASPSSTAAYLMKCSTWDDEAEAYLRAVLAAGGSTGGVPSAYPSTIFESAWTVSTLLENGFVPQGQACKDLGQVANFLECRLHAENGVIGFAPNLLADADDTAKSILCLNLLGRHYAPDQMISMFENDTHFKTYTSERNSSFSANCNVLNALVHVPDPGLYLTQILKATTFLCKAWYDGPLIDKWNLSNEYPNMLLAQALSKLLRVWSTGSLGSLTENLMHQIPIVLFQILVRTLASQDANGSWGDGSTEVTAYAILTLACLEELPWARLIAPEADLAIQSGRRFLHFHTHKWKQPDYIWIEKVTYGNAILSEAYCIAAAGSWEPAKPWGKAIEDLVVLPDKAIIKFQHFFSRLPLFSTQPTWKLSASLAESYLFLPKLKEIRLDIFPRTNMKEDKYLSYIPFTWTACNNFQRGALSTQCLWDMMIISMLNYQADEYMEVVVGEHFADNLEPIKSLIRRLCGQECVQIQNDPASKILDEVDSVLTRFTSYVLQHPKVLQASAYTQRHLRRELATFLLAHATHIEDSARFTQQVIPLHHSVQFASPKQSYFEWVRTTSADHTSCPYSFSLFSCLIGDPGKDVFQGVRQHYISQDLCRHLATMCRQYNDYGSLARDRAEKNLNSVNFTEFGAPLAEVVANGTLAEVVANGALAEVVANGENNINHGSKTDTKAGPTGSTEVKLKEDLFWIAEYERECLNLAVRRLEEQVGRRTSEALKVFVSVTDLYGQIYVARDIATPMK